MSWSLLLRMDANTLIMGICHSRALGLYMMQQPKSLTLCWQSVDAVWILCWQSVDALLTLICRLGMGPCRVLFCPSRLPICSLWIPASKWHPNGLTYKIKNRWRSIDAHFQNVAVTVSIPLLPIKAAQALVMDNSEQIGFQWTYLPQNISLTLRRRSVSECGHWRAAVSFAYRGCQSVEYESQRAIHFPIKLLTYPKIIDAPLMLIVKMELFPCPFNHHIVIIDSQWIICINTQLHAQALWCINFW